MIEVLDFSMILTHYMPASGPTNSHDMTLFGTFYRYEFELHLGFGYLLELFLGFWLGLGLEY